MRTLKQSTSVNVTIGPFLDSGDGITPETALTITQPDILLSKIGGAWAQKAAAQTLTHQSNGWYQVQLDSTDTNTLGILMLAVTETGAVPVWHEFQVVPAAVYDAMFSSTLLTVNVTQWNTAAVAVPTVTGVPKVDMTHVLGGAVPAVSVTGVQEVDITHIGGVALASAVMPANVKQISDDAAAADILELFVEALDIATGQIDNGTFATGAINSVTIASGAIGSAELGATFVPAIWAQAGVEPGSVPAHTAAVLDKIDFIYAAMRNKVLQTATLYTLRNDADSGNLATAAVSDDGTTLTRNELA